MFVFDLTGGVYAPKPDDAVQKLSENIYKLSCGLRDLVVNYNRQAILHLESMHPTGAPIMAAIDISLINLPKEQIIDIAAKSLNMNKDAFQIVGNQLTLSAPAHSPMIATMDNSTPVSLPAGTRMDLTEAVKKIRQEGPESITHLASTVIGLGLTEENAKQYILGFLAQVNGPEYEKYELVVRENGSIVPAGAGQMPLAQTTQQAESLHETAQIVQQQGKVVQQQEDAGLTPEQYEQMRRENEKTQVTLPNGQLVQIAMDDYEKGKFSLKDEKGILHNYEIDNLLASNEGGAVVVREIAEKQKQTGEKKAGKPVSSAFQKKIDAIVNTEQNSVDKVQSLLDLREKTKGQTQRNAIDQSIAGQADYIVMSPDLNVAVKIETLAKMAQLVDNEKAKGQEGLLEKLRQDLKGQMDYNHEEMNKPGSGIAPMPYVMPSDYTGPKGVVQRQTDENIRIQEGIKEGRTSVRAKFNKAKSQDEREIFEESYIRISDEVANNWKVAKAAIGNGDFEVGITKLKKLVEEYKYNPDIVQKYCGKTPEALELTIRALEACVENNGVLPADFLIGSMERDILGGAEVLLRPIEVDLTKVVAPSTAGQLQQSLVSLGAELVPQMEKDIEYLEAQLKSKKAGGGFDENGVAAVLRKYTDRERRMFFGEGLELAEEAEGSIGGMRMKLQALRLSLSTLAQNPTGAQVNQVTSTVMDIISPGIFNGDLKGATIDRLKATPEFWDELSRAEDKRSKSLQKVASNMTSFSIEWKDQPAPLGQNTESIMQRRKMMDDYVDVQTGTRQFYAFTTLENATSAMVDAHYGNGTLVPQEGSGTGKYRVYVEKTHPQGFKIEAKSVEDYFNGRYGATGHRDKDGNYYPGGRERMAETSPADLARIRYSLKHEANQEAVKEISTDLKKQWEAGKSLHHKGSIEFSQFMNDWGTLILQGGLMIGSIVPVTAPVVAPIAAVYFVYDAGHTMYNLYEEVQKQGVTQSNAGSILLEGGISLAIIGACGPSVVKMMGRALNGTKAGAFFEQASLEAAGYQQAGVDLVTSNAKFGAKVVGATNEIMEVSEQLSTKMLEALFGVKSTEFVSELVREGKFNAQEMAALAFIGTFIVTHKIISKRAHLLEKRFENYEQYAKDLSRPAPGEDAVVRDTKQALRKLAGDAEGRDLVHRFAKEQQTVAQLEGKAASGQKLSPAEEKTLKSSLERMNKLTVRIEQKLTQGVEKMGKVKLGEAEETAKAKEKAKADAEVKAGVSRGLSLELTTAEKAMVGYAAALAEIKTTLEKKKDPASQNALVTVDDLLTKLNVEIHEHKGEHSVILNATTEMYGKLGQLDTKTLDKNKPKFRSLIVAEKEYEVSVTATSGIVTVPLTLETARKGFKMRFGEE